eukprot:6082295-Amphidinium_carterae.1
MAETSIVSLCLCVSLHKAFSVLMSRVESKPIPGIPSVKVSSSACAKTCVLIRPLFAPNVAGEASVGCFECKASCEGRGHSRLKRPAATAALLPQRKRWPPRPNPKLP